MCTCQGVHVCVTRFICLAHGTCPCPLCARLPAQSCLLVCFFTCWGCTSATPLSAAAAAAAAKPARVVTVECLFVCSECACLQLKTIRPHGLMLPTQQALWACGCYCLVVVCAEGMMPHAMPFSCGPMTLCTAVFVYVCVCFHLSHPQCCKQPASQPELCSLKVCMSPPHWHLEWPGR